MIWYIALGIVVAVAFYAAAGGVVITITRDRNDRR